MDQVSDLMPLCYRISVLPPAFCELAMKYPFMDLRVGFYYFFVPSCPLAEVSF